jgi:hypothetical protein
MGSKRGQKAKKRAKRESRRETRRAQRIAEPGRQTDSIPLSQATDSEPCATLVAPAYIVEAGTSCWNCLQDTAVFALAAEGIESLISSTRKTDKFQLISSMTWLSPDLQQHLTRHADSQFFLDESPMDGSSIYLNHCRNCGAPLNDLELFCEPGGAFFPMDEEECQRITLVSLPDETDLRFSGQSWYTTFDWETYARRR